MPKEIEEILADVVELVEQALAVADEQATSRVSLIDMADSLMGSVEQLVELVLAGEQPTADQRTVLHDLREQIPTRREHLRASRDLAHRQIAALTEHRRMLATLADRAASL